MTTNFETMHKDIGKKSAPAAGGYPDPGTGRYAEQLTYEQWYLFTLDQRTHKNYLEFVTIFCYCILVVGIVAPITALILGCLWLIFRLVYTCGYLGSPKGRTPGAVGSIFTTLAILVGGCVVSGIWIYETPWRM